MKYSIDLGFNLGEMFAELHNKDILGAKFKIGDRVIIKEVWLTAEVTGVNCLDVNDYEYSLKEYIFLYYENELILLENKNEAN